MRIRKHRPLFRDPTTRYVGRDDLDDALGQLDPELVEVLAAQVYGITPRRLARRMDTAVGYGVQFLIVDAMLQIRDSPRAEGLLEELRADHGPRYSRVLRDVAQHMEIDGAPRCRHCAALLGPAASTGRPRLYCGNACRQAAYRQRTCDQNAATDDVYRRGLAPPSLDQEPVSLPPLKPPRHGYRPGEQGSEEYRAKLLDKWAGRVPRQRSDRWVAQEPQQSADRWAGRVPRQRSDRWVAQEPQQSAERQISQGKSTVLFVGLGGAGFSPAEYRELLYRELREHLQGAVDPSGADLREPTKWEMAAHTSDPRPIPPRPEATKERVPSPYWLRPQRPPKTLKAHTGIRSVPPRHVSRARW